MTPSVHPATEQIADLLEGSLPAREAVEVNTHLAGCTECGALRDALLDVTVVLGDEGATGWEMPADVTARLDEALSQASSDRASDVRRLGDRRRSLARQPLRWLAVAAAAVVVAGAGLVGWHTIPHHDTRVADAAANSPTQQNLAGGMPGGAAGLGTPPTKYGTLALPNLGAGTVASAARQLARRPSPGPTETASSSPRTPTCASPTGGEPSVTVLFHGRPSVLTIDPTSRTATIYDCGTASHRLFTTVY